MPFAALDRIAVTTGPGSFTGLRVGISAARGIALAAGKPAFGLTTLAAFAAPYIADDETLARRGRDRRPAPARLSAGVRSRRAHAGRAAHRQRWRDAVRIARHAADPDRRHRRAHAGRGLAGRASRRRCWSTSAARPTSSGSARLARSPTDEARARPSRSICARPTRSRKPPRDCRADDRMAHGCSRAASRRCRKPGRATRRASRRLHAASFRRGWSDGEIERLLIERNMRRAPRHRGPHAATASSCRGSPRARRKSFRSRWLRRGAAGGWRARCSICTCGGSRGSARAPCFSKSTRTTSRRGGSTARAGFREVGRRPGYYQQGRRQCRDRAGAAPRSGVITDQLPR